MGIERTNDPHQAPPRKPEEGRKGVMGATKRTQERKDQKRDLKKVIKKTGGPEGG